MKQACSVAECILVNSTNQPACLAVCCRSVKCPKLISANTHTDSKQEGEAEREHLGPNLHGVCKWPNL